MCQLVSVPGPRTRNIQNVTVIIPKPRMGEKASFADSYQNG
jgi:hypothetical protein